jgi:hypothetical protein
LQSATTYDRLSNRPRSGPGTCGLLITKPATRVSDRCQGQTNRSADTHQINLRQRRIVATRTDCVCQVQNRFDLVRDPMAPVLPVRVPPLVAPDLRPFDVSPVILFDSVVAAYHLAQFVPILPAARNGHSQSPLSGISRTTLWVPFCNRISLGVRRLW